PPPRSPARPAGLRRVPLVGARGPGGAGGPVPPSRQGPCGSWCAVPVERGGWGWGSGRCRCLGATKQVSAPAPPGGREGAASGRRAGQPLDRAQRSEARRVGKESSSGGERDDIID